MRTIVFAKILHLGVWHIDSGKQLRGQCINIAYHPSDRCAVCLGDYQKNDKLQQLPVCGHVFHKDCVDEWLANHSTCPICRSVPIPSGKVVPMESPAQRVLPALGSTRLLPVLHAPRSTSASEPGLEGSCALQSDLVRGCGESSSNSNVRASDGQDPQKVTGSTLVEHSIQIQT